MSRTKVRSCEGCANFAWDIKTHLRGLKFGNFATCAKGHTPRFIKPKVEYQDVETWGYRRACLDYEAKT